MFTKFLRKRGGGAGGRLRARILWSGLPQFLKALPKHREIQKRVYVAMGSVAVDELAFQKKGLEGSAFFCYARIGYFCVLIMAIRSGCSGDLLVWPLLLA